MRYGRVGPWDMEQLYQATTILTWSCILMVTWLPLALHIKYVYFAAVEIHVGDVCSRGDFDYWTSQLKVFIEREFRFECKIPHRAVEFVFQHQEIDWNVDLLVSPYWSTPQEFIDSLIPLSKKNRDL